MTKRERQHRRHEMSAREREILNDALERAQRRPEKKPTVYQAWPVRRPGPACPTE